MTYEILSAARRELDSAIVYYENQCNGLGLRFIAAIRKVIGRILENPKQFPAISKRFRKAGMRRFPYSLIFFIQDDIVRIVAVAHGKQRPGYWKGRLR